MKNILAALLLVASVGAKAAEPTELLSSVGQLFYENSPTCSVSKIAKNTFLTAGHCVKTRMYNAHEFQVKYKSNPTAWPDSRSVVNITIGAKEHDDWAILKTDADIEDMDMLRLNCGYEPKVGDEVETAGYPSVMGKTYSKGYVSSIEEPDLDKGSANYWVSLRAAPGASGSPVTHNGEQVGILVSGLAPGQFGLLAVGIHRVADSCTSPSSYGAGSIRTVNPGEFLGGPF